MDVIMIKKYLMVNVLNRWYKVTAMFTDKTRCNEYLSANYVRNAGDKDEFEGVIRIIGVCTFIAKNSDAGVEL